MMCWCGHGHAASIPEDSDHPVSIFMDDFYKKCKGDITVEMFLDRLYLPEHPQVWNNECYRNMVRNILVCIGTNLMLRICKGGTIGYDLSFAVVRAEVIMVLENYSQKGTLNDALKSRPVAKKWRDLVSDLPSGNRDVLKFYRKRITCKCLKKVHLEARKTIPKQGWCWNCEQEFERAFLSVCSKCMIGQYCSRECQVAGWPEHKTFCKGYA